MSAIYFYNEVFGITTETQLYAKNGPIYNNQLFDYIITINGSLNNLFSKKTYQQDPQDVNKVIINFEINSNTYNNHYLTTNIISTPTNSLINGVIVDDIEFDTRILEILALKIFGHARARAALSNDMDIIHDLQNEFYNHINNVIQNHKYDIFNQYVQLDKRQLWQNDINRAVSFNFTNGTFAFPGYISGSLFDKNNLSSDLLNGPKAGISWMENGDYNIPILIKINSENAIEFPDYNSVIIFASYTNNNPTPTYIALDAKSIYDPTFFQ
jgi:hypothetical protein